MKFDGRDPEWALEPQTAVKHAILRRYLGGWFAVFGYAEIVRRAIYVDGFAGPGAYSGGEPGSPLVALSVLLDHSGFDDFDCEFVFLFCEPDERRFPLLEARLAEEEDARGGWPKSIRVHAEELTFTEAADQVLDVVGDRNLAPTFAFLDPFGVRGLAMADIARLLRFPRCEVLANFASQGIRRFWESPEFEPHLDALFGTPDWRNLDMDRPIDEQARTAAEFFKDRLRGAGGFKHVISFRMVNAGNQDSYYLVFGTGHLRGLELMKDAMWKVDETGEYTFSAFAESKLNPDQEVFFTNDPDLQPLVDAISARFSGSTVPVESVEEFVLAETIYRRSVHTRDALKLLEEDGRIAGVEGRKRSKSYPKACRISFG